MIPIGYFDMYCPRGRFFDPCCVGCAETKLRHSVGLSREVGRAVEQAFAVLNERQWEVRNMLREVSKDTL